MKIKIIQNKNTLKFKKKPVLYANTPVKKRLKHLNFNDKKMHYMLL